MSWLDKENDRAEEQAKTGNTTNGKVKLKKVTQAQPKPKKEKKVSVPYYCDTENLHMNLKLHCIKNKISLTQYLTEGLALRLKKDGINIKDIM